MQFRLVLSLFTVAALTLATPAAADVVAEDGRPDAFDRLVSAHERTARGSASAIARASGQQPSSAAVTDPVGDTTDVHADITAASFGFSPTKATVSATLSHPTNPRTDYHWQDGLTGLMWDIEVTGDGYGDYYAMFIADSDGTPLGGVFRSYDDALLCNAAVSYNGATKYYAEFHKSCIGGATPARFAVVMLYDTNPYNADDPAYDVAHDTMWSSWAHRPCAVIDQHVSIDVDRKTTFGDGVVIRGRVTKQGTTTGIAGRPVIVRRRAMGTANFSRITTVTSAGDGRIKFTDNPKFNVEYRLDTPGEPCFLADSSSEVGVFVAPRIVAAWEQRDLERGQIARIQGHIVPRGAVNSITLERYVDGEWHFRDRKNIGSDGDFRFAFAAGRGVWSYRLRTPADHDHAEGRQNLPTLRVS